MIEINSKFSKIHSHTFGGYKRQKQLDGTEPNSRDKGRGLPFYMTLLLCLDQTKILSFPNVLGNLLNSTPFLLLFYLNNKSKVSKVGIFHFLPKQTNHISFHSSIVPLNIEIKILKLLGIFYEYIHMSS